MNKDLFPAGLSIFKPDLNSESMSASAQQWNLQFTQMQKGNYNINLKVIHTPRIQLSRVVYSQAMLAKGSFPKDSILLFYTKTNGEFTFHNRLVNKYELIIADTGMQVDYLTTSKCEVFSIVIEKTFFYESFYSYYSKSLKHFIKTNFFHIKKELLVGFLDGLIALISHSQSQSLQMDEKNYLVLENKILKHIFLNIDITQSPAQTKKFDVSKLRNLLQNSLRNNLDMSAISKKLNVSERQLHNSFKLAYGFTPKQYVKNLRLNAIRKELLIYPNSKISDVAIKYNYLHMGHFSSEFKKMFGQTPSRFLQKN